MNKKSKIVMNAMVGSESKTISRMLESVAPYIDYYVIQCNGSDDTEQKINEFFKSKNIPGFTYQIEWNFPGWNRDHTLQKCLATDHGCDWILRMDADERLHVDEDFDWSILNDTSVESYNITAQAGGSRYFRTWFWNAKLPWFFQHDKRHETIHLPEIGENFQRLMMPYGFRHLVSQDGDTWAAPRKFLRDALELEIDKVVGNKVHEDYYHLWYIAKSYADCYGNSSELPFGRKHSEEYARRSNWYYDRFMELTHHWGEVKKPKYDDEMAYFALIVMGWNYDFIKQHDKAREHFLLASEFSPERNENLLYLAFHYESLGKFEDALQVVELMMKPDRKNPFPEKSFLIEDRAYVNTGNFLFEFKNKLTKRNEEHVIDSESFKFDFQ
jgi:glycosyltransferase involved in cell wall biosynthesis